jgi:hypothetical protein
LTFFEYITVATSIVLALAIARVIDGLRGAFSLDRRYWIHAAWVSLKLTNPISFWWNIWAYRNHEAWNLLSFALLLAWPIVLYLQITGLVSRQPELVNDWKEHFYSQRKWFFGANTVLNLLLISHLVLLGEGHLASPFGAAALLYIGYSIVGFSTANEKTHGVIVATAWVGTLLGFWAPGFAPR